jgi:hypothetical protein
LNAPDDARRIPDATRLLRRLLDAGLSRFEPDPIAALERAASIGTQARHRCAFPRAD